MSVAFSQHPGRHERHYRRRVDNPLFANRIQKRDDESLLEAQRLDHEELLAFIQALRTAVQEAVDLAPNEGSEVILGLKERLDRLYEQSAGLAEEQKQNQAAIAELIEVIMKNIERGAAGDPQALDELAQERQARSTHFALLEVPLVADLLHPQSAIAEDELAATLLSADESDLAVALQLFDAAQISELYAAAERCLAATGVMAPSPAARLQQISDYLARVRRPSPLN